MSRSFVVLKEEASRRDLFADQTHEKVAESLFNVIANNPDSGLTIGLEGGWGTGKSTVIAILKEKLQKLDDTLYFYFDAWAHEGDPLRRVFLESIIEQLGNGNKQLINIHEKITNRTKTTTVNSQQQVTGLGKLLALASLFVPVGIGIIGPAVKDVKFRPNSHLPIAWLFLISLVLSVAPIFVLLGNLIRLLWSKHFCLKCETPILAGSNWMFLQSESNQTAVQELSSDSERSSIEFEQYFEQILSILLEGKKCRRILLVIDNLDRVSTEDSIKIWSTLQTFLQGRNPSRKRHDHYSRLWIIVPYDPEGMSTSLEVNDSNKTAYSMFEKFFQLRIDVPNLIISGWEAYCKACIDSSFIDWLEDEKQVVLDVLKKTRANVADAPSPRQVKIYLNQVGLMRIHADAVINIESIAYFVVQKYLVKRSKGNLEDLLLQGNLPSKNVQPFFRDSIQGELCGLLYGVAPDKGVQILLESKIAESLSTGNTEKLISQIEIHDSTFWTVFNLHIQKISSRETIQKYCKTIFPVIFEEQREKLGLFFRQLEAVSATWSVIDFPYSMAEAEEIAAQLSILDGIGKPVEAIWQKLITSVGQRLKDSSLNAKSMRECFEIVGAATKNTVLPNYTIDGVSFESWKKWAIACFGESRTFIGPPDSISDEVSPKITQGNVTQNGVYELICLMERHGITNFAAIGNAFAVAVRGLGQTNNFGIMNEDAFRLLYKLTFFKDPNTCSLFNTFEIFHLAAGANMIKYLALCLAKAKKDGLQRIQITHSGNSNNALQQATSFWRSKNSENAIFVWNIAREYSDFDFIWDLAEDKQNILIGEIFSLATTDKHKVFFESARDMGAIQKWLNYFKSSSPNTKSFCSLAMKYGSIQNSLSDVDIEVWAQELDVLLTHASTDTILQTVKTKILRVNKSAWEKAFSEDTYLLNLSLLLKGQFSEFSLLNDYSDALIGHINACAYSEGKLSEWQKTNLSDLFALLSSDFQVHNRKLLAKIYAENEFKCHESMSELLLPLLDFTGLLETHYANFEGAVDAFSTLSEVAGLKLIARIIGENKHSTKKPDRHYSTILRIPLLRLRIGSEADVQTTIDSVAHYFDVDLTDEAQDE
jgi:hypothetical protein